MIEGRIEIKADDLSQKIVEVLDVERKVDVVKGQMGYDLHRIYPTPDGLHIHFERVLNFDFRSVCMTKSSQVMIILLATILSVIRSLNK